MARLEQLHLKTRVWHSSQNEEKAGQTFPNTKHWERLLSPNPEKRVHSLQPLKYKSKQRRWNQKKKNKKKKRECYETTNQLEKRSTYQIETFQALRAPTKTWEFIHIGATTQASFL